MTRPAAALLALLAAAAALRASDIDAATRAKAERVFSALDAMRNGAPGIPAGTSRRMTISEDDLNAYIACRIADENEPVLKDLRLKLLDGNAFEGLAAIDLGGTSAAGPFRGRMTLLFRVRVESASGRARLAFDDVFCEGQRIQPDLLDLLILVGSRLTGNEPFSLKDWFSLPEGVRRLEVGRGAVVAVYGPA